MNAEPKPKKTCRCCGKPIKCELNPLNGQWFRSAISLIRIDPKWFFCTLRCAAKFGVKAASQQAK